MFALLEEAEHFTGDLFGDCVAEAVAVCGDGSRIRRRTLLVELPQDVLVVEFGEEDGKMVLIFFRQAFLCKIAWERIGEHHAHDAVIARASCGIEPKLIEHHVAKKRIDFCFDHLFHQGAGCVFRRIIHGGGNDDENA